MRRILAVAALMILLLPLDASASSNTDYRSGFVGLIIMCGIAYNFRDRAIGGWLLFYYILLYMKCFVLLVFIPPNLGKLIANEWASSSQYACFLISTIPVFAFSFVEVYAATYLQVRRSEANLRVLQKVLWLLAIACTISIGIDLLFFKTSLNVDILAFVTAAIWVAYFRKSRRVQLVFIKRAWNPFLFPM